MRSTLTALVAAAAFSGAATGAYAAGATGGAGGPGTSGPGPAAAGAGMDATAGTPGFEGPNGANFPSSQGASSVITPGAGSANSEAGNLPRQRRAPQRAPADPSMQEPPPSLQPEVGTTGPATLPMQR